jgi:peptide/nickel transport system substrate-binding protein
VVFSLNYLREPKNAFIFRSNVADIANVEKVDDYTVKVTTKAPSPFFLELIAPVAEVDIIPKHVVERGDDLNKVAIGTGEFKLKEFDRTKAGVFTRNDAYWQKDRPYVDQVQLVLGLDDPARLAGFVAGKFDVHSVSDKLQLDAILPIKRDTLYAKNINAMGVGVVMKQDAPPFNDPRVRQAMHLFLDRQELNQAVASGEGTINPPGVPAIKEGWAIPQEELLKLPGYRQPKEQDIAEAKRLLAEAGYPNGFKTTLHYGTSSTNRGIAEPVAAQFAKLGVNITLTGQPPAEQTRTVSSGQYALALEPLGDMNIARYQWDHLHGGGALATMGFQDPQLDRLLEAQRSSLNISDRKQAVRAMQDLLMEKLYFIPTVDAPTYQLWQPWVNNYNYDQGGSPLVGQHNLPWVWLDLAKMPADRRRP